MYVALRTEPRAPGTWTSALITEPQPRGFYVFIPGFSGPHYADEDDLELPTSCLNLLSAEGKTTHCLMWFCGRYLRPHSGAVNGRRQLLSP